MVHGKTARKARIDQDYGIAFQQAGLLDWRTVQANVELPTANCTARSKRERRARSAELLEIAGLTDFARPLSGRTVRRHAAARRHRPRPGPQTTDCC